MSAELLQTPVDEFSGVPYCFAAPESLAPVAAKGANLDRRGDWNHMFPKYEVKTSDSPVLQDDLAKLALISARVQWVDYDQHHYVYNPQFVGPPHPQDEEALATTLVMTEAGFVPEMAIDLSGSEPRVVGQTLAQRHEFWLSGQVRAWDVVAVRKWLFGYVFRQEVDHIRESELDEFLHTFNLERRIHLGHCLAAKMVERAVEPIDAVYSTARKQGLLPVAATANIRDFVKPRLTPGKGFGPVFSALHQKLGSYNRERKLVELVAA